MRLIEETSTITALGQRMLGVFLGIIEKDIAAGSHVRDLPSGLSAEMRRAMKEVRVDLDEELETLGQR